MCVTACGVMHPHDVAGRSFKSLVNDFVYSFGRGALLLLVEV